MFGVASYVRVRRGPDEAAQLDALDPTVPLERGGQGYFMQRRPSSLAAIATTVPPIAMTPNAARAIPGIGTRIEAPRIVRTYQRKSEGFETDTSERLVRSWSLCELTARCVRAVRAVRNEHCDGDLDGRSDRLPVESNLDSDQASATAHTASMRLTRANTADTAKHISASEERTLTAE